MVALEKVLARTKRLERDLLLRPPASKAGKLSWLPGTYDNLEHWVHECSHLAGLRPMDAVLQFPRRRDPRFEFTVLDRTVPITLLAASPNFETLSRTQSPGTAYIACAFLLMEKEEDRVWEEALTMAATAQVARGLGHRHYFPSRPGETAFRALAKGLFGEIQWVDTYRRATRTAEARRRARVILNTLDLG